VRLNALQIANAARFVYATENDFDLVSAMMATDRRLRTGLAYET
jgi:hypothetical protein